MYNVDFSMDDNHLRFNYHISNTILSVNYVELPLSLEIGFNIKVYIFIFILQLC